MRQNALHDVFFGNDRRGEVEGGGDGSSNERQLTLAHLKYIVWRVITAAIKNSCNIVCAEHSQKPRKREEKRQWNDMMVRIANIFSDSMRIHRESPETKLCVCVCMRRGIPWIVWLHESHEKNSLETKSLRYYYHCSLTNKNRWNSTQSAVKSEKEREKNSEKSHAANATVRWSERFFYDY